MKIPSASSSNLYICYVHRNIDIALPCSPFHLNVDGNLGHYAALIRAKDLIICAGRRDASEVYLDFGYCVSGQAGRYHSQDPRGMSFKAMATVPVDTFHACKNTA